VAGVTEAGGNGGHEVNGRDGDGTARRRRRPRRRAGAAPAAFARKTAKANKENPPPESPEDLRDFDEGFWRGEMPPHWG